MTDYSELKKAAEVIVAEYKAHEFTCAWPDGSDWFEIGPGFSEMDLVKRCSPTAVLEMIAEIERLRESKDHKHPSPAAFERLLPVIGASIDSVKTVKAALESTHRYSYMPCLPEEAYKWFPHAWVIAAMRDVAAPPQLAELQAQLDTASHMFDEVENSLAASVDREIELQATIERQAAEIAAQVQSALRRSFTLGQIYWQQADSDSTSQQNKSDQTMETQEQHILNVLKSISACLDATAALNGEKP
ncbi:hypothetical protein [Pseudomonas sp. UMAB-40]|uniref:hypothetical protein n=1 Tax=Pseudomonas sp. UMAB-40 TaxID=1365407 RepID=UPI001C56534F|nr:hypothetical protein [Pseudomonas sp. UMAB-40]